MSTVGTQMAQLWAALKTTEAVLEDIDWSIPALDEVYDRIPWEKIKEAIANAEKVCELGTGDYVRQMSPEEQERRLKFLENRAKRGISNGS